MSQFMMSESLKGVLDESQFLEKATDEPASVPILAIQLPEQTVEGQLVHIGWDDEGRMTTAALNVALKDVQKVLEGKVVSKIGYRTSESEKTTWVVTDERFRIALKSVEEAFHLTVTVHYSEDM